MRLVAAENSALLDSAQLLLDLGQKWHSTSSVASKPPLSFDRSAVLARQAQLEVISIKLKKSVDHRTSLIKQVDDTLSTIPELKVPKPM